MGEGTETERADEGKDAADSPEKEGIRLDVPTYFVNRTHTLNKVEDPEKSKRDEGLLAVNPFPPDCNPAYVRVAMGLTLALPKRFEFVRIDVGLTMPCYREEVDEIYPQVYSWVADRLFQERDEVRALASKGSGEEG